MNKLLIVESRTKAMKIWKMLSHKEDKWEVIATFGHFYELPQKELGIDIDNYYKPNFQVLKVRTINTIEKAAKKADVVYVATDPDREGEKIAFDSALTIIKEFPNKKLFRVRFYEITKKAVDKAIENSEDFDYNLYQSQITRRVLDRLIGFILSSKILWKNLGLGLTVGRVQSCVLDILCKREEEIHSFISTEYWKVIAELEDSTIVSTDMLKTENEAKDILKNIPNFKTEYSEEENLEKKPPPPFNTANLIKSASIVFNFSSDNTMKIAQKLFESGLISYHRTDSIGINMGFASSIRKFIEEKYGKNLLPEKIRFYPSEGAHEAIRVTDINNMPSSNMDLTKDEVDLYRLIWARTLCCQAKNAIIRNQKVVFKNREGKEILIGTGATVIDEGFYKLSLGYFTPKYHKINKNKLKVVKSHQEKGMTQPPHRYSESDVIEFMEKKKIGRPSTYATTIQRLITHTYVRRFGKSIKPTLRGMVLSKYVRDNIKRLVSVKFTAEMEETLDKEGIVPHKVIDYYYRWIKKTVKNNKNNILKINNIKCECTGSYKIKFGQKGNPYVVCEKCGKFKGLDIDNNGAVKIFEEEKIAGTCEKCNNINSLVKKQSKYGIYIQCNNCKAIISY